MTKMIILLLKLLYTGTVLRSFFYEPNAIVFSILLVGPLGILVFQIDLLFLNAIKKNFLPRTVIGSDYVPGSSWEKYFVTFGINMNVPFWARMGRMRLSKTHFTLAFLTSMKGLALCHEPLKNISSVRMKKNFFRAQYLVVTFTNKSSLNFVSLFPMDPEEWLCHFEDVGVATAIDGESGADIEV